MEWTPAAVGITAKLKEPFAGRVILSASQDEMTEMTIVHDFVLTPGLPLHLPLVTKLAFSADRCDLKILDSKGRKVYSLEYELFDSRSYCIARGSWESVLC